MSVTQTASSYSFPDRLREGYRAFIAARGIDREIADILTGLDTRDLDAVERASAAIRAAIEAQPFPLEVEDRVAECYRKLSLRACVPAAVNLRPMPSTTLAYSPCVSSPLPRRALARPCS